MKIAIFAITPLAASPWELWKALRKYTDLDVELVNGRYAYPDGRVFPFSLLLNSGDGRGREVLKRADLWHVHNAFDPGIKSMFNGKALIAQFHSLPRLGAWKDLWNATEWRYTIRQPLHEKEYELPSLPNIIDPDEYRPKRRKPSPLKIAFAPSTRSPSNWPNSKGYDLVKKVLNSVAMKRDVDIVWIEGKPYLENLELKANSHILIDDVVTGNWHRTSLEGACFGCVVINKCKQGPWFQAEVNNLEERLLWLIDNPGTRRIYKEMTRAWVLSEWHAMDSVKEYVTAYRRAMQ